MRKIPPLVKSVHIKLLEYSSSIPEVPFLTILWKHIVSSIVNCGKMYLLIFVVCIPSWNTLEFASCDSDFNVAASTTKILL